MQQNIFHFPFSILHLQGAVYPSEQDSTPIAELAARLLLKPNVTRVSCGRTTNNTYRIEWRDAYGAGCCSANGDGNGRLRD